MRLVLVLILVCFCVSGCRISPRAEREIALLRAEILDLEDQYYTLKSQRDSAAQRLRDCCDEEMDFGSDPQLRSTQYIDTFEIADPCIDCEPNTVVYDDTNTRTDRQPRSIVEPNLMIEDQVPAGNSGSDGSGSRLEEVPAQEVSPDGASLRYDRLPATDGAISEIVINRRFSRGQDIDGVPGHEGLSLLIQPKNELGQVDKIPGHLTVRIVEPKSSSSQRQIGLWQFKPAEIESFFIKDEYAEQGILLHLPWDKLTPAGPRLNIFVQYVTNDRRKLDTSAEIFIEPPKSSYSIDDPLVARWIEYDERWEDSDSNETRRLPVSGVQSARTDDQISKPRWRPVR